MLKKLISAAAGNYKISALILGMVSAAVFPPFFCLPIFLAAMAAMFALTDGMLSVKKAAAAGYWYGFGFFAAGFYWIGNALLVDAESFGWLYPLALLAPGVFFGLFMIPPFVVWHFSRKCRFWHRVSGFAAAWVLLEWVRSFILTGFPWNLLGTAWAFHPAFLQTASFWGTYGLSFAVLLLAGSVYALFCRRWYSGAAVFLLLPAVLYVYGTWRIAGYEPGESGITVRLVQPSIPQQMKWEHGALEDNLRTYIEMSRRPGLENVDFVIWGETAVPFDLENDEIHRRLVSSAVPPKGFLAAGLVRAGISGGFIKPFNSMYVLNPRGDIVAHYDKSHLVPFGEYIPFRQILPAWIRPITGSIADFAAGRKFKNIQVGDYPAFAPLICYEVIFPDAVIDRKNKPAWLVVLTNDGWYGDSTGPYQHLVAAQMRAVEEGVSVVRSANSGISALIDPLGRVVARIPLNEKNILDVELPLNLELSTFYNYYGNRGFLLVISLILLSIFWCRWRF